MSIHEVSADVKDRLLLARQWLTYAIGEHDAEDAFGKALMRLWVEVTRDLDLDELGRYTAQSLNPEEDRYVSLILRVPRWVTFEAFRAAWLAHELRKKGLALG